MATINTATHFGLERELGSIAPGRRADLIVTSDLRELPIEQVIAQGRTVAKNGEITVACPHLDWPDDARQTVHLGSTLGAEDFEIKAPAGASSVTAKVIGVVENQAPTEALKREISVSQGLLKPTGAVCQIALVERHRGTGEVVNALVEGFGYEGSMAMASTVAHDSHHMIVVGTDRAQMALAANRLADVGGGVSVWKDGEELALVELPIAGLMSDRPAKEVAAKADQMVAAMEACGCTLNNAYMQHSGNSMNGMNANLPVRTPDTPDAELFSNPKAAVQRLCELYDDASTFLINKFRDSLEGNPPAERYRAYYPEITITTQSFAQIDTRLSFGHVAQPGTYSTTVTRPDLFRNYLEQQIQLLVDNHGVSVQIGASCTAMPMHFAVANATDLTVPHEGAMNFTLRDVFDVPDLATTNDDIVNGTLQEMQDVPAPLAPFTAQRIDYSLARLSHYTATAAEHFQNHVLFTNYQFYVEEFEGYARQMLADSNSGYTSFVSTGNHVLSDAEGEIPKT
ncbi:Adenine deaminase [Nymphon striatum]|nr:Adenine deaminase [Nymphon striatum]